MSVQETDRLLAAAAKRPSPVYLAIGEPFQTGSFARRLIEVLVPPPRRSLNVETYDGRVTAIAPILDSLRTPGLFPGTKVIWVREPPLFLSGEKRSEVSAAALAAWNEDRHAEAADKLLTLAAMAGWSQERFAAADWAELPDRATVDLLGRSANRDERGLLEAIRTYCVERNLALGDYRDESGLLQDFLRAGMPGNAVLLFTASTVDRRKRIVNVLREVGTVVEFTLARERSGALTAESVAALVSQTMAAANQRVAPGAQRLILQRAGTDAGALSMELEKLSLYAGEASTITEEHVQASFRDLSESWIFDFTRALSQRQPAVAVRLLRGLFEQGEHPLRLLALIARELRLLLLARDCLTDTFAGKWQPRLPFADFRDRLLPLLSEAQREAFGGLHPYALYQSVQHASRMRGATLRRAVLALHELDIKFKSSRGDARGLLEAFVLDLCRSA